MVNDVTVTLDIWTFEEMADRIEELEGVLKEVDQWVEELGVYADPTYKPAPIFLKVREALSGKRNTGD